MSIIGFAFFVGILIWWAERKELQEFRKPAPCHICWVMGEFRMVRWGHGQWVHADTGRALLTTSREASWKIGPHHASPRTYVDTIRSRGDRPAGAPPQWQ